MSTQRLISQLLDLIFPPRCCACEKFTSAGLCPDCLRQIEYIGSPVCSICGKPYDNYFVDELCEDCSKEKPPFAMARSAALYDGVIKEAVHKFKFENITGLSVILGKIMADHLQTSDLNIKDIDAVVPIPLSKKRHRERSFNQSELLARIVADRFSLQIDTVSLKKSKEIKPQFKLEREERLTNIKGAFSCISLEGKNVLLIDDIYTTGATVLEASLVLKAAGAKNIYVFTLARAVEP